MSLLLWGSAVRDEHEPWLARLAELGYDGVEVPVVGAEMGQLERTAKVLDGLGLERTAVGFATAEADPIHPQARVRHAAVAHLEGLVDRAVALGASLVAGPIHSAYGVFSGHGPSAAEREHCLEVLGEAADYAAERGVRLGLEYLNRFENYFLTTAAEAAALVRELDHPALCAVLDTHHAHIEEEDTAAALRGLGDTLGHVQISENHRGVPGRGQVDWEGVFRALRELAYDGWLVVESFSRNDPELGANLRIWRELSPSLDDPCREGIALVRRMWDATGS